MEDESVKLDNLIKQFEDDLKKEGLEDYVVVIFHEDCTLKEALFQEPIE